MNAQSSLFWFNKACILFCSNSLYLFMILKDILIYLAQVQFGIVWCTRVFFIFTLYQFNVSMCFGTFGFYFMNSINRWWILSAEAYGEVGTTPCILSLGLWLQRRTAEYPIKCVEVFDDLRKDEDNFFKDTNFEVTSEVKFWYPQKNSHKVEKSRKFFFHYFQRKLKKQTEFLKSISHVEMCS